MKFNYHHAIEHYLNTTVYFAEPYKSGQRGTNENTNGLIRQFIPKSSVISFVDDEQIKKIQYLLNTRQENSISLKALPPFIR
ncbi:MULTISPECIES: IS30 family transposase, partial [unclassified Gilliamella]|uniref:IS30 family transposase n=1 Tax=unclassified Gilliamella TaxID=2685620 RepID=UPI0013656DAC